MVQEFLRAVAGGEIEKVREVLAASPEMVNAVGPHPFWGGRLQPLHVSIENQQREVFDLLLEAGADVNGSNGEYEHWSPLMLAVKHEGMREELLRRGARYGLLAALLMGDDAGVEKLLRRGAPALPDYAPGGGSILNFARTVFAIDRLLELGASTTARDRWGATPIEAMSRLGPAGQSLVRRLIAHGVAAAPEEYARLGDRTTLAGLTAADPAVARSDAVMMGAVDFGHHELVKWLLAQGANPNARAAAPSRHTALHSAAWNGDLEMVKILVAAGADRAARDEEHQGTPFEWAEVAIRVRHDPANRVVAEYLSSFG